MRACYLYTAVYRASLHRDTMSHSLMSLYRIYRSDSAAAADSSMRWCCHRPPLCINACKATSPSCQHCLQLRCKCNPRHHHTRCRPVGHVATTVYVIRKKNLISLKIRAIMAILGSVRRSSSKPCKIYRFSHGNFDNKASIYPLTVTVKITPRAIFQLYFRYTVARFMPLWLFLNMFSSRNDAKITKL